MMLNIYVKKGRKTPEVEQGVIPIKVSKGKGALHFVQGLVSHVPLTGVGYSKGCLWAKLTYPSVSVLFINLHLPIKTSTNSRGQLKNASMGYEYRKESFYNVLEILKDKVDANTYVIVGGDLNFRINANGDDQLSKLLDENTPQLPIPLRELPFPNGQDPSFTCKFKEVKSSKNINCRLQEISDEHKQECLDESRRASRCDRFLINKSKDIYVQQYKAAVLLGESDHNGIYASISLPIKSGGGKTRRKPSTSATRRKPSRRRA